MYRELLEELEAGLSDKMKKTMFLEIILMTYSYVHRAINAEAFPVAPDLYSKELMTGRGRGRYCYRQEAGRRPKPFCAAKSEGFWVPCPFYISAEATVNNKLRKIINKK